MDPVSLVLNALTSGAAQGVADSVSDSITSAYTKLPTRVYDREAGRVNAWPPKDLSRLISR